MLCESCEMKARLSGEEVDLDGDGYEEDDPLFPPCEKCGGPTVPSVLVWVLNKLERDER